MIAGMTPVLMPGDYVFASVSGQVPTDLGDTALAVFREEEGVSLLLPAGVAAKAGFDTTHAMRRITLTVYSALDGIGLTAAVAERLTALGIPCNVIAATHHDHVFVPAADADRALAGLLALQSEAATEA